jgi:hypothetical protein
MMLGGIRQYFADVRRMSAPYPCRAWETRLAVFNFVSLAIIAVSVFAARANIELLTQRPIPWVWILGVVYGMMGIMIIGKILLKRAELRLCRLNEKGLRCWDCGYPVEKGLGDRCSECGMSIAMSRTLWSNYKPLRPWNQGGMVRKFRAEARAKKS